MALSMAVKVFLLALMVTVPAQAAEDKERNHVNPIRKIVTMLQAMSKKVEAEGEKEKELYDKFMCYCQGGDASLKAAIDAAKTKVPQVTSSIEESEASKAQLSEDLKTHASDRDAAKAAMGTATALREKEAAAFAATKAESQANIAAMGKATAAIEKSGAASFLQSTVKQTVINVVKNDNDVADIDRQDVLSFLSGTDEDSVAGSGQIVGILKTMQETMEKDLADAEATEAEAVKTYDELMAAKKKEIEAATVSIEKKTKRVGEVAVEIVQMKGDLSDTQDQLVEDQKFLAELDKTCASKQAEWAERVKMRQEELLALADTIKMLNSDDALELFKKTLPAAESSFVQVEVSAKAMRNRALAFIRKAQQSGKHNPRLDLIALALSGKKAGLDGVIKMIDDMAAALKKEQEDDDHKKEYCLKEIDVTEDKKKAMEHKISDLETSAAEAEDAMKTLESEIDALGDGIRDLDKSVAEATENRKEENEDYALFMSSNAAAKELIGLAKNRMQKFYNPKLYKPTPEAPVFVQVSMHTRSEDILPPAPETFGAYTKSEESGGVMAMMDMITKDIDAELSEAEHAEKNAQEDYEEMMKDSKDKRALDTKALTDKESTKASVEAELQADTEAKAATTKELMATSLYLSQIHGECDFLLEYFDTRKEARTTEADELMKGKAALSGADIALVQTHTAERSHYLRKSA